MNSMNFRRLMTLGALGLSALARVDSARAATMQACDLVPQAEVSRIVGADVPIAQRQAPVEKDGATSTACYYQLPGMEGVNASLTLQTFSSAAAAQARLKAFVEQRMKLHALIGSETVAGLPATAVTLPSGVGQLWMVRGNQLVAAGATSLEHGKATPRREFARALLTAALKNL